MERRGRGRTLALSQSLPATAVSVADRTFGDVMSQAGRDTQVRTKLAPAVELRVWAKAAGRCVLCATYLLDERTTYLHTTKVGEVAHIVGATPGAKSPRGQSALDLDARATEENLLLLCHACHRMVDDPANVDEWTEEHLTFKKQEHEARVRRVTDFSTLQRTLVVTTVSTVRAERVSVTDKQVTHSLIEEGLIAHIDHGQRGDVVVTLPEDLTHEYAWKYARGQIDAGVRRVRKAIDLGADADLSVFALAPISLLVYLGAVLDDTSTVRVFDRHRDDHAAHAWTWRRTSQVPTLEFDVTVPDDAAADAVVVEVAVSGTARVGKLPADIVTLPRARMELCGQTPRTGVLETRADLAAATDAWARTLSEIERKCPSARTVHIIAAVPVSLAVNIGRRRMRGTHPEFVVYELNDGTYVPTPPITDPED
jgi:hypothetical protein